jgi:lysophospholipase L1-like esterase
MSQSPQKIDVEKFDEKMRPEQAATAVVKWHSHFDDGSPMALSGFAWFDQDRIYRRMPKNPRHTLSEAVDGLANCTAGGQLRFQTDSQRLSLRVRLSAPANMVHMPATGQCGFDLYAGAPGRQRYLNTTKYDQKQANYDVVLLDLPTREMRNITLYFPLYQGVQEVSVGLAPGSEMLSPPPFLLPRPVVFYGTSITQGGCACRPGMAYTNILSRRLNLDVVNLGFSGSGKGEPEVARTITEIQSPAGLVLDYEANVKEFEQYKATLPEFIRILRETNPHTPLLIVARVPFSIEHFNPLIRQQREERTEFARTTVAKLRAAGDRSIYFHDMAALIGTDYEEGTVDGVHPTDLGFIRMADSLEPVVRTMLGI